MLRAGSPTAVPRPARSTLRPATAPFATGPLAAGRTANFAVVPGDATQETGRREAHTSWPCWQVQGADRRAGLAIAALAAACNPAAVAESSAEAPDAPGSMTDEPVIESIDVELPQAALPPEPPPVEAPFALSETDVYLNAKWLAADVAQARSATTSSMDWSGP